MKTFLIFFQGFLLGRTGSTVMGITLLLSLIWWGGPYIGLEAESTRLYLMLGVLCLVLCIWLGRMALVRYRSGKFKDALQSSAGDDNSPDRQAEIEELREKMDSTIASLKSSSLGIGYRGNAALYALPWYLIIGPSAAGKTTLLRNSGLHFPYDIGENSDIKGFGGTRNCDWWFSDEAVILDTAGRYTTEEDDKPEWTAFLGLLKRYRPKLPINGVIVAISLADILTADKEGIEWHVKVIRDRLNELVTHLGGIFPVYLTITKTDLLHGFSTYFEEMSEEDRQQVWGTWLVQEDESDIDITERLREQLNGLYGRLNQQRLHKISMQRKLSFKDQILDFPMQFKEACEKIQIFFDLLVKENPYQETPRFCGTYFTSGAQEGTPIQRIIGNLRHAFGFVDDLAEDDPHAQTSSKGFFIKNLFKDVIFPNSQGVTKNRKTATIQKWLKTAWILTGTALVIGSFILFSTSLTSNTLLVRNGVKTTQNLEEQLQVRDQSLDTVHLALAEVFDHYETLLAYDAKLPWHLIFGIYEGDEQITPVKEMLLNSMQIAFFNTTLRHMEYRLTDFGQQWDNFDAQGRAKLRDRYYAELQSYLMVSEPAHLQIDTASPVLSGIWMNLILRADPEKTFSEEETQQLERMVVFYLNHITNTEDGESKELHIAAWEQRDDIVSRARQNLLTPPNAEHLYAQIINKGKVSLKNYTLDDLLKGSGRGVMDSPYRLSGSFTAKGWRDFVHPEIDEVVDAASRGDWVLGSYKKPTTKGSDQTINTDTEATPTDEAEIPAQEPQGITFDAELAAKLKIDIREQYFKDYAEAWFALIASIEYTPASTLHTGMKNTLTIARSDGPLGEFMRIVAKNINPTEPGDKGLKKHIPELDIIFGDLRKFANPADKMNTSLLLNQYLLGLSTIQGEMERLAASVNVTREASLFAAKILSGNAGQQELYRGWVSTTSMLTGIEPRTRKLAENLFISPIRNAWDSILQEAAIDLQLQWKNNVVTSFDQSLRDKFPFDRNGKDAALADVGEFFHPKNGDYWKFVNNYLKPYLTKGRGAKWRAKTWLDRGPHFSKRALAHLSRTHVISTGLFTKGTDDPSLVFHVYPVPSQGMTETFFAVNGQEYRYRNGPQEWLKFTWPGSGDSLGARVMGLAGREAAYAEMNYTGVWGVFRLLDKGKMKKASSREYQYSWTMNSNIGTSINVKFKLKADRAGNVFNKNVLLGYSLPRSLF